MIRSWKRVKPLKNVFWLFKGPGSFIKKIKIGGNVEFLKAYRLIAPPPPFSLVILRELLFQINSEKMASRLSFFDNTQPSVLYCTVLDPFPWRSFCWGIHTGWGWCKWWTCQPGATQRRTSTSHLKQWTHKINHSHKYIHYSVLRIQNFKWILICKTKNIFVWSKFFFAIYSTYP